MNRRYLIVDYARSLIGTPFHHRARLPGVGIDCAQLVIWVGVQLGCWSPETDVPEYTRQPDGESMRSLCREHLISIQPRNMDIGDIILTIVDRVPQHLGILGPYDYGKFSIIHASNRARPPRVIETRLMFARDLRFVEAYSFPESK